MKMMNKTSINRRNFLKGAAGAAGILGFPTIIPATALGNDQKAPPSERVTVGVIGCGYQSRASHSYNSHPKAQIVAAADPIKERRDGFKITGIDRYNDFREILARDDVDAVHVVTADHWHVPISLLAARAGKHTYTEKPLGISIEEDLAAWEISRKHKRVFQYGAQNRSMYPVRAGTELVLNGHIGEIKKAYVWCPPGHSGGSPTPEIPIPDGYDYDMWLGPAPVRPFCHDRCIQQGSSNGIFHIYDYAIGFIAGWGAHPMETFQWWLDEEDMGVPVRVEGTGVIPTEGLFNTLTNWNMKLTYANGFEVEFMDKVTRFEKKTEPPFSDIKLKNMHGTLYVGTKGWIIVNRKGWEASDINILKKGKDPGPRRLVESTQHQHNFIDAILGEAQTVSTLGAAIRSDITCHLCDIAARTKRPVHWDPEKKTIVGDEEQVKMMHRSMRAPWDKVLKG